MLRQFISVIIKQHDIKLTQKLPSKHVIEEKILGTGKRGRRGKQLSHVYKVYRLNMYHAGNLFFTLGSFARGDMLNEKISFNHFLAKGQKKIRSSFENL
jgi:hypothetical protein